jgi:hypothetical protein
MTSSHQLSISPVAMISCAIDFTRLLDKSAQFSASNLILSSGEVVDTKIPVFSNVHSDWTSYCISGHVEKSYEFSQSDLKSNSIGFSSSRRNSLSELHRESNEMTSSH